MNCGITTPSAGARPWRGRGRGKARVVEGQGQWRGKGSRGAGVVKGQGRGSGGARLVEEQLRKGQYRQNRQGFG